MVVKLISTTQSSSMAPLSPSSPTTVLPLMSGSCCPAQVNPELLTDCKVSALIIKTVRSRKSFQVMAVTVHMLSQEGQQG